MCTFNTISHLVALIFTTGIVTSQNTQFAQERTELFSRALIDLYGSQEQLTASNLDNLIQQIREKSCLRAESRHHAQRGHSNSCSLGTTLDVDCLFNSRLNSSDIYRVNDIPAGAAINWTMFRDVAVAVLFELQKENITSSMSNEDKASRPSTAEVWGYGFLAVTIINICACLGALFYPLRNTAIYTRFLMFMVALGIGTLCASAILVLIPEAFGLMQEGSPFAHTYLGYALVVMAGGYMFFVLERFLKFLRSFRKRRRQATKEKIGNGTDTSKIPTVTAVVNGEAVIWTAGEAPIDDNRKHGHSHGESGIKPVAWMVVFGDAVHNFVDGLSIGAAFSRRVLFGVSVSLAITCEELPHELGDFAILLNAGMSVKKALLCNLLSACSCYVGLVIGILIGELEQGSQWIFAIAGGMFLYISLVDMLPELNEEAEREADMLGSCWPVFITHNLGLLTGVFIIYILARYGDTIDIEASSTSAI